MIFPLILAALVCSYCPAVNASEKESGATLDDVSVMKFSIEDCGNPSTIDVKNFFTGKSTTLPTSAGRKFYVVTLVGQLDGLHEKYRFVTKEQKRFVALYDVGKQKEYSEGIMIMGLFGWQIDGRNWVLAPKEDRADPGWRDKERFTVAFALPEGWKKFEVAVRKNAGAGDSIRVGEVDTQKIQTTTAAARIQDGALVGDLAGIQALLDQHPELVAGHDMYGFTPLHFAAIKGQAELVQLLLARKADVEAQTSSGSTALNLAARNGQKVVVELLLANKASINTTDNNGWTPLHTAAALDRKDVVELLLMRGADANAKDRSGMTPLRRATANKHPDIAQLIRQHGGHE